MTTASDVIRELFAHHTWATITLLEEVGRLDEGTLDTRMDGTYGSIAETLTHLVDADDRYLQRMYDPAPPPYVDHGVQSPVVLRDRVRTNLVRWAELLDDLDAGGMYVTITDRDLEEPRHTEGLLFLQAIHHGNEHRTHVCSILGALDLDVPDLDGWAYWSSRDRVLYLPEAP
jgi:uncharacterized damage-inducible protein DinB